MWITVAHTVQNSSVGVGILCCRRELLTRCVKVLNPDLEKKVSEGKPDSRTEDGDDDPDNGQ